MKALKERHSQLPLPTDFQPEGVQRLVELCRRFLYEYYETDAPWSGPNWWLTFNDAGTRLYKALENKPTQGSRQPLGDQEQEQAYVMLMRVAYFFDPGGLAESFFREQGWPHEQARGDDAAQPVSP